MTELYTERLVIRAMTPHDAPFMLALLNEPGWLRYIGDRQVHTVEDAERYIRNGPMATVEQHGFGFGIVALRDGGAPVGMCGLTQRDYLDHPDLGYALLAAHEGKGYVIEAARAVLAHARASLGRGRILATTRVDNLRSATVLEKLGLRYERTFRPPGAEHDLRLFGIALAP